MYIRTMITHHGLAESFFSFNEFGRARREQYIAFWRTGPDPHDLREEEAEKKGPEGGLPSENS